VEPLLRKPSVIAPSARQKKNGVHQVEMRDAKGNSCVFLLTVEPASAGGNDNSAVDESPRIIL
jgi:hypothetical protein